MKRMCKKLLAAMLCMLLTGATAEGMLSVTPTPGLTPTPMPLQATPVPQTLQDAGILTVLPEDGTQEYYTLVRAAVPAGEAMYILTYRGMYAQLWRWTEELPRAQRVGDEMLYAHHHVSMAEARQNAADSTGDPDNAAYAVSTIFSDGEKLYGYNGLDHSVFSIDVKEDEVTFAPVVHLAKISTEQYLMPESAFVTGDWLIWHDTDYSQGYYTERVIAFSLRTGGAKQAVIPATIRAVAPWRDGQALVLCRDQQDSAVSAIWAYDPVLDSAEVLGTLPRGLHPRSIAYNAALDVMVYQDRTRLMGWTPEGASQIGYMPVSNENATLYTAADTVLYATINDPLQAVNIREGYATDRSITMLGGTMYSVLSQFYNRYQDVPVYYAQQKNGETWQEILSRETDMPDLWLCTSPSSYMQAVQAGALMDLSAYPPIAEYVELLYPAFRDMAKQNGGIYAVPVYAASYGGWYINKEVMNEMGLTAADVPTTFEGLVDFAQRWNDEWAEKYPHFTLLNETTNYRERFYYAIENEWRQLCEKAGKPVNYDDPTYLSILEKLDGCDFTKLDAALKQTDPEVSEYKQALIWTGVKDVGNFDTYMEDYSDRIFLPLTLTADTPYVTSVQENRMWVVNARSQNAEYCAALLEDAIGKLEGKTAYTLRSDMTEPVEDESFADALAYQLEYLARLESAVEDSVNKDAALRRVEEQKAYIENGMNGLRYVINPSAIEHYRSVIMPAAYVVAPSDVDLRVSTADEELERRYLRREITAQELVKALDAAE